jgi:hypothetical protein
VSLVSINDQAGIGRIINTNIMEINFVEQLPMLAETEDVLRPVAE